MQDKQKEKKDEPRTILQNRSLHKWLRDNAELMKKDGITVKQLVEIMMTMPLEMYPTQKILKEIVWRPIQKIMLGKESTTELTKAEIDPIIDIIVKNIGQFLGYTFTPFPSIENQDFNDEYDKDS